MAKAINLNALKPVMNILDIKKAQELANIDITDVFNVLERMEKENETLFNKEIGDDLTVINKLIEGLNKKIVSANAKIGKSKNRSGYAQTPYSVLCKAKVSCNLNYFIQDPKDRSHYAYFKVTDIQTAQAMLEVENKKQEIELKYENIKAQIMLAGDYAQIKDILGGYGIALDAPVSGTLTAPENK